MTEVGDVPGRLRILVRRLRDADQPRSAALLEEVATRFYTTSSEMLGEIGLVALQVQALLGDSMADDVASDLSWCVAEVRKVWPNLGG